MSNGFSGLSISLSGIYANKKALDTVSHNIANVNNSYYVRQQAIHAFSSYSDTSIGGFQVGTGVDVQQIRQIRDEFLDIKYRQESKKYGYWEQKNKVYEEVEIILDEISENGLQKVMDQFWDGWNELAKEPDSLTVRALLHERAVAFTETVNRISEQLDNLQLNLNKDIYNKVAEVNKLTGKIAELNEKIASYEVIGTKVSANDYRDTRNNLLDELSKIVPIQYYEDNRGYVTVSMEGRTLVSEDYCTTITTKQDNKGYAHIYWEDIDEKIDFSKNGSKNGQLAGLIEARDVDVENVRNRLNELVKNIAGKVNEKHKEGYDLLGNNEKIPFFVTEGTYSESDIDASNIIINPALNDFNKIAAGKTEAKGDGQIAEEIVKLRYQPMIGDMTSDDYYRDIISELGVNSQEAASGMESQGILLLQIDNNRKAISGVSLDEEMADMLKYQHSYEANARVVNAIDEMLDNIINKMGIVGR